MNKRMEDIKAKWKGSNISVDDLKEAELEIVKYCQREKFAEEISALQIGQAIKRNSSIYRLNPQLHSEVLCVGGRLSNAAMPEESKRPMIIPKDLHITNLILQNIHEKTGHSGRNHMTSTLQQKYWIPGAKSAIRKMLARCVICRRLHSSTGKQIMADLPSDRVLPDDPPFTRVGVDYFGPFMVKRGRSLVKKYGVYLHLLSNLCSAHRSGFFVGYRFLS